MSNLNEVDEQYLEIAQFILEHGLIKDDRTGTGTISFFSPPSIDLDLEKGFPLLTTKKMAVKSIIEELLWFISGSTHIKPLLDQNVKFWGPDAYRWYKAKTDSEIGYESFLKLASYGNPQIGGLGPIYGKQWRAWKSDTYPYEVDQLQNLITGLRENPNSRRHIVSAWNVGELDQMALPPCHMMFQCWVDTQTKELSLKMYQR